jgi:M6 family metalloprotease-like protein
MKALFLSIFWPAVASAAACKPQPPKSKAACKLAAVDNVDQSVGFDYNGDCAPTTGTLNGFMIFVDFSDAQPAQGETPQSLYDAVVPQATEWYKQASQGALSFNVTADRSKFYRMPASAASYGWERGLTWAEHQDYIQDALDAYTAKGTRPPPPESDVLYVIPVNSAGGRGISRSITFLTRANTRQGDYVARKTVTVGTDAFTGWGPKSWIVLAHETGHTMCLADYYPFENLGLGYYVGGWSAMGDVSGIGTDFFAWDKWRMGWIKDDSIDCVSERGTTEHTLTPLELKTSDKDIKAVVVAANQTSALVAEARISEGLDSGVCAPGVLLYTVDTSVKSGSGPVRVLDVTPGSGGCGTDSVYDKNDGTLSLVPGGVSSYKVPGWGVKVTVVKQTEKSYTIQVNAEF